MSHRARSNYCANIPKICHFSSVPTRQSVQKQPSQQQLSKDTATCIIIAPKRLKLRVSGSARKSQKRFRDTPRFNFRAVLARTQPFLSRSVRNGATNPDSNAEKWPIIMQFAVLVRKRRKKKTKKKKIAMPHLIFGEDTLVEAPAPPFTAPHRLLSSSGMN
jgi:hypothetical protein